ncbi:HNH endonuclease signature motif containing protein [Microbacterium lacusdiani]
MVRQSFGTRWDLDPARRDAVATLIEAVATADRMIAEIEAVKAGLLAAAQGIAVEVMAELDAPSTYQLPVRAIAADIAAATNVADGTIRARMDDAVRLIEKFPATYAALCEGRLSRAHASVIAAEGARLEDEETRSRYERVVLKRAMETTAGRLRPIAQAVAERLEPTTFAERHATAREARRTWVDDLGDGMSAFHAVVETVVAHAAQDRLTQMAMSVRDSARREGRAVFGAMIDELDPTDPLPTDERTMAQVRADVFADLVLTGHPTVLSANADGDTAAAIRARVQITIPAETLAGLGDEPAFLAGHGPVDPDTARRLAGGVHTWTRLFVDPGTGCLRTVDAYTPTADQKRFLAARDEHCRFPGCRQPVHRCDLDHTIAHSEGGQTGVCNLAALCRTHHVLKHNSPWGVEHGPDGTMTWISPTGHRITDTPAPTVRFVAALEAADLDPPPSDPDDPAPF